MSDEKYKLIQEGLDSIFRGLFWAIFSVYCYTFFQFAANPPEASFVDGAARILSCALISFHLTYFYASWILVTVLAAKVFITGVKLLWKK